MRILSVCLVFLLYVPSAQADDIDQLSVGEGVYIEGFFSDELVYITHIDRATNRVRVRRADDSVAEWVHASRLITEDASRVNDIERGVVAAALLLEGLNQIAESTGSSSSRRSSECSFNDTSGCDFSNVNQHSFTETNTPRSETPGRFRVENSCEHPIRLAIRYKDTRGNWDTLAWWEIPGNTPRYLQSVSDVYVETEAGYFYFYAASEDGNLEWGGNHNYPVDEATVGMKMMVDDSGDRDLTLTCPGP